MFASHDAAVVEQRKKALLGETVHKRLADLADTFGRKPQTTII